MVAIVQGGKMIMGHTQLAIVEPSNRFTDLPFNLTFHTVNVKTEKSTMNLAVKKDDGASAEKMLMEREKRRVAVGDVTVCGSTRRETMTRAKAIRMTSCRCPRNIGIRMKGIRRRGRAMRCNNNKNGSEGDDDGAVVYS